MAQKKNKLYSSIWQECDQLLGDIAYRKGKPDIGDQLNKP